MRRAVLAVVLAAGTAQAQSEAQTVTWDEVEGLRLSSIGYRATDDPCRRAGETALTADLLDHTRDLVACPKGDASIDDLLERMGAAQVGGTESFTLLSVPRN